MEIIKTFENFDKTPIRIDNKTLEYVYKIIDSEKLSESVYDDLQTSIDKYRLSYKIMDSVIRPLMTKLSKIGVSLYNIKTKKENIMLYKTSRLLSEDELTNISNQLKDIYNIDENNIYLYDYKILKRNGKNYFLFQF